MFLKVRELRTKNQEGVGPNNNHRKERNKGGPKSQRYRQSFLGATAGAEGRHSANREELGGPPQQRGGPVYLEKVLAQGPTLVQYANKGKKKKCLLLIDWKGLLLLGQKGHIQAG